MHLYVDNRSGVAIYEQLYQQIRSQILHGELNENASLPSIRGLAKDLQISVITTKKAYDKLEEEGYIYTAPGRGSFVSAKNEEIVKEDTMRRVEECLGEAVRLCRQNGIGREELLEMLEYELEEQK